LIARLEAALSVVEHQDELINDQPLTTEKTTVTEIKPCPDLQKGPLMETHVPYRVPDGDCDFHVWRLILQHALSAELLLKLEELSHSLRYLGN
jgi:hypothetical protein